MVTTTYLFLLVNILSGKTMPAQRLATILPLKKAFPDQQATSLSLLKISSRGVPRAVYVLYERDALKMNTPNHLVSERWFAKRETE